ncbi:MAG: hypothetical protein ACYDAN_03405 [Candidatus Limnocylindrales bacterium]
MGRLATVTAAGGIRLRAAPEGSWLKGPGAVTIAARKTVMLDMLRVDGQGMRWWAVAPVDDWWIYGWVAERDRDGHSVLAPATPPCPDPDTLTAPALKTLASMEALACYGSRPLTLRGTVRCEHYPAELAVGGASWLDSGAGCVMDESLGLQGQVATSLLSTDSMSPVVTRRAEVRGHFDDAEARACFRTSVGLNLTAPVNPPEPSAVLACRASFVVDSATLLP